MRPLNCPASFVGIDIVFELIFLLICLYIAYKSLQIAQISKLKEPKYFGIGFLLLGSSYGLQAVANSFGMASLVGQTTIVLHIITGLLALVTLAYTVSHVKKPCIYVLLALLMGVVTYTSVELFRNFYLVATVFYAYIVAQLLTAYFKKQKTHTLYVASAFALLLVAHISGAFSLMSSWSYVIAHVVSLVAYIILLATVLMVKHEKKA